MNKIAKTTTFGLLVLLAGSCVALTAQAGESGKRGPVSFAEFDQDGNGFVSEEEFNAVRQQRMAAKAAEGKQMKGAASAPSFTGMDTDGDGQLNADELAAGQKAHREKMHAGRHKHGAGHHGKGKCKGEGECHCKGLNGNKPAFADFDLDADGRISEQEFTEGHASRMAEMAAEGRKMKHAGDMPTFASIDQDGDGGISPEEFAAHQAEHHHRHQHHE